MSDEWLTIKDMAEMAGVTQQAIYKRLNSTLSEFVKQVGKRKYINIAALEHIESTQKNQPLNNDSTKVEQPLNNVELIETVNKTIELLQKQLEVKDKQLEAKDRQIETKDKQIQSLNDSLDNALKNSSQSNFLLAQEKIVREVEEKKPWYKRMFGR